MRHTLYVFWMGQPLGWFALILLGWLAARSVGITTLAYSASWVVATGWAAYLWYRETRGFGSDRPLPGETRDLALERPDVVEELLATIEERVGGPLESYS